MARYIEEGKSIFIPFWKGYSITDSQLHLRMYKTAEMFKRHFPNGTNYDVLCEYAPVVRCKDCAWNMKDDCEHYCINPDGLDNYTKPDDFCSYGERRTDE